MKTKVRFSAVGICRVVAGFALGVAQNANSNPDPVVAPAINQTSQDAVDPVEGESWIGVPLEVSVSDLADGLNALSPKSFHDKQSREVTRAVVEDYVEYTVNRGSISLQAQHGHLAFTIPVSGTVTVGGQVNPLHGIGIGRGKHAQQSAHVKGTLSGHLDLRLNSDWSISPEITLDIEFDQAEVRLFGIPISIKRELREAFERNLPAIKKQLAAKLNSGAKLKENAASAWQGLHLTKQIATSPPIWMTVKPLEVVAGQISVSDEGRILSGCALRCSVAGKLGDRPVPEQPTPLPPLRVATQIPTDCRLHCPFRADFDGIAATLNERFATDPIKIGDAKAYLREIHLTAVEKKIRLEGLLKLDGEGQSQSLEARVAIDGTPVIDSESDTICLPDLTLNLLDNDAANAFAKMFLEPITADLRRRACYSYKADLERLRSSISALSPQSGVEGHHSLSLTIEDINVGDLKLLPHSISILAKISGKARLLLR